MFPRVRLPLPRLLRKAESAGSDPSGAETLGAAPAVQRARYAPRTSNLQHPSPIKVDVLQLILSDDEFRNSFRVFLGRHHCAEGLEFWEKVQARNAESSPKKLASMAKVIMTTHILEGSEREIHLSSALRAALTKASASRKELAKPDLFNGALQELINDLKQNEYFADFLNALMRSSMRVESRGT